MAGTERREILTVAAADRTIDVEVFRPALRETAPAILFLHELYGVTEGCRADAADLASRGYLVYLPNLYTGGMRRYCIRAMVEAAGRENRADSPVNAEVHGLLDAMKADPECNGRMGMLGACLTGGYVIQMARRSDMLAPVVYHHSLGLTGAGVPEQESLDSVIRLQGHFSSLPDPYCPARKRRRLAERLGDRLEAYTYPMPHGFRSTARHMRQSGLVWDRTRAFFDRYLQDVPAPASTGSE